MNDISLDVIAIVHCEDGCSWEDGEYTTSIQTIGCFDIQFIDDFTLAASKWVAEMAQVEELQTDCLYQLIMRHVHERDGWGVTTARYFNVIDVALQRY